MHKLTLLMPWQTELYVVSYVNMQVKEFCRLEKLPRLATYLFHGRLNEQLRKCRVEMYTRSFKFQLSNLSSLFQNQTKTFVVMFQEEEEEDEEEEEEDDDQLKKDEL